MSTAIIESLAELDGKLTMPEAAKRLGISLASLWRYTLRGSRGVRLKTVALGGRRFVTEAALLDFVRETSAVANGHPLPTPARSARRRKAQRREIRRQFGIDED